MSTITASEYIIDNFDPEDRLAVVMKFSPDGALVQRVATAERIASEKFQAWLRHMNARGANIYISMNALKPETIHRTKEDVASIRHLYLDVDENGPEVLKSVLADSLLPKPSYVLNTSPDKYQVVWKVTGFSPSQAEHFQRNMAAWHRADRAATDVARVLRIPGLYNRKYDTPFEVTAEKTAEGTYRPPDFRIDLNATIEVASRSSVQRSSQPCGISQSERDWAETLRRLSRGENPAFVQAFLEQKRQDKHDPHYYAERTVSRALEELARRRSSQPELEL
jgi:hypothetical protein